MNATRRGMGFYRTKIELFMAPETKQLRDALLSTTSFLLTVHIREKTWHPPYKWAKTLQRLERMSIICQVFSNMLPNWDIRLHL